MKEQIYHILIKKECGHNCPMCCNKLFDLDTLPSITGEQLRSAHTVCLTGGEPFAIDTHALTKLCENMRKQYPNIQKIYIYTSGNYFDEMTAYEWKRLIGAIDGLNVSPKNQYDWGAFYDLTQTSVWFDMLSEQRLSNRLYVFDGQFEEWEKLNQKIYLPRCWKVIGRKWDTMFNTPENEHFVRLPILY